MIFLRIGVWFPVWLAVAGVCTLAVAAPDGANEMKDVAMGADGQIHGQVVDAAGAGVPSIPVSLHMYNKEVATATTDKDGQFAVSGLKGGVYEVKGPQTSGEFRIWHADAAPPNAAEKVVLTQTGAPCPPVTEPCPVEVTPVAVPAPPPPAPVPVAAAPAAAAPGLLGPALVSAAVATAIAVPLSVSNDPKPHSP